MRYISKHNFDESEIIRGLHNGDENVLKLLFAKFHVGLLYFSTQYLTNALTAEDIVAESFLKVWQRKKDFHSLPAIKSFLYVTVKNACLNHLKQINRYNACHEEIKYLAEKTEELFSDQRIIKAELLTRIWENVEQLPPIRQKIFKMLFVEGLNTFEVARILRISVDTVRVQKARALNALRKVVRG